MSNILLQLEYATYMYTFKMLDAGVPQGLLLVPFLFLLYINDISNGISNNIRWYADDTSLFAIIDDNDDDVIHQTLSITNDLNTTKIKTVNVEFTRKNVNFPAI